MYDVYPVCKGVSEATRYTQRERGLVYLAARGVSLSSADSSLLRFFTLNTLSFYTHPHVTGSLALSHMCSMRAEISHPVIHHTDTHSLVCVSSGDIVSPLVVCVCVYL